MGPDIDEHVAFPSRCEDSKILKQDGEFDEEGHKAVDDRRDIDPLNFLLVPILQSSIFDQSYVKHLEKSL